MSIQEAKRLKPGDAVRVKATGRRLVVARVTLSPGTVSARVCVVVEGNDGRDTNATYFHDQLRHEIAR